ncbi:MAG TPA: hypothetical protein VGR37_02525, partial [Longimicrobiaceae bacterium]|nr:hypothetical protein [Longimicrobiaceae bacterium]
AYVRLAEVWRRADPDLPALDEVQRGARGDFGPTPAPQAGAATGGNAPAPAYLYVWATAIDTAVSPPVPPDTVPRRRRRGVALLTVDLREGSPTRGQVVGAVLAADTAARFAHHTEHALAADGLLFANDFGAGRTHRFDLRTPGEPRRLGDFTTAGPFGFPHSFVQLPNGNVLATFQRQGAGPPGGLVELRRDGTAVRWARAATSGADSLEILPYSLEVLPALDRVVTTSHGMGSTPGGVHVQVWRLSDLALLHTLRVPEAPAHTGHDAPGATDEASAHAEIHHRRPGEPRALADGRTVMVGTFTCGMYRLNGVDGQSPRLEFVHAFPSRGCAVPVRVGRWWVQTVPSLHALVSLDMDDPAHPRELARLPLGESATPHWLATDASGRWLIVDSGTVADPRVYLATLDPATGALAPHPALPAVELSRVAVPGLGVVRIVPHGAVFGPGAP